MEYWMQDTDLIYCDSNAGIDTPNHEMIVYSQVIHDIAQLLSIHKDPFLAGLGKAIEGILEDYEGYFSDDSMLNEVLNNFVDSWDKDNNTYHDNHWDDIREASTTLKELVNIINNNEQNYDIRVDGVIRYDWIRIKCYRNEVCIDVREYDRQHHERILNFLQSDEFDDFRHTVNTVAAVNYQQPKVEINISVWGEDRKELDILNTSYEEMMTEKYTTIKSRARRL